MMVSIQIVAPHQIPENRCWLASVRWQRKHNPNRWQRYWHDCENSTTFTWLFSKKKSFWRLVIKYVGNKSFVRLVINHFFFLILFCYYFISKFYQAIKQKKKRRRKKTSQINWNDKIISFILGSRRKLANLRLFSIISFERFSTWKSHTICSAA